MEITIAMPVYQRDLLAVNAIKSLCDITLVPKGIDVTFVVAVNELKQTTVDLIKEYSESVTQLNLIIHQFDKNQGKAVAVNFVADTWPGDFIVTVDGDMVCIDPEWLKKMVRTYFAYNKNPMKNPRKNMKPMYLGSLCANQLGLCGHNVKENDGYGFGYDVNGDTIITSIANGGIAGGVLMSDYQTWSDIGGYSGHRLVAADDGDYHLACWEREKIVAYMKDVYFYHPHELPSEYREWKNSFREVKNQYIPHSTTLKEID